MVFRTKLRSFRGHISILGILEHSNLLELVVVLSYLLSEFFDMNFSRCASLVLTSSHSFLSSVSHPLTLYITYVHLYRAHTQSFSPCSRLRHVLMYRDFSLFFFFPYSFIVHVLHLCGCAHE